MPVRNVRARRGRVAAVLVVVVIGLLAFFADGARSRWLIEPGPLALKHSAIANCDSCHGTIGEGPVAWLHAAMSAMDPGEAAGRCLACHSLGAQALATHGRPPAELAAATQRIRAEALRVKDVFGVVTPAALPQSSHPMPDLACTACHQEHRGLQANLRTVGDAVCQTCHLEKFKSLSDGHPEFKSYPYHRRTRMIFDHAAHYQLHFAKSDPKAVPSECTSCHVVGPVGRVMTVGGFDANCAACHADQIRGKSITGDKGIPVFLVPGLDIDSLQKHGIAIGQWPKDADGQLSPFMQLLLSADPATRDDLARLGDIHLTDLRKATDDQIAAAGQIVWAVKSLLFDLSTTGPAGIEGRIEVGLTSAPARMSVADLMAGLPLDTVRNAQQAWFPDLASEVALHRAGKPLPNAAATAAAPAADANAAPAPQAAPSHDDIIGGTGGGLLGGSGDSVGSDAKPATPPATGSGHDDIIGGAGGGLLAGSGDAANSDAKATAPNAAAPSHDDIIGGSGGGLLGGGGTAVADSKGAASPLAPNNSDKADIISGGGGGLLGGDTAAAPAAAPPADTKADILQGGDIMGGAVTTQPLAAPAANAAPAQDTSEAKPPKPVEGEDWAALGGWYRQDFALFYRPTQHADRFMRAWLDASSRQSLDPQATAAMKVFGLLADPAGPGTCVKCHSVDQTAEGLKVNWRTRQPDPDARHATNFSHTAHFSLFADNGCESCHQVASGADVLSTYKGTDPSVMITAFRPMPRVFCAKCHVAEKAGDSCTTCHSYHVGQVPLAKGVSTMHRDQDQ